MEFLLCWKNEGVEEEVAMVALIFLLGDFMFTEAERWRRLGMAAMEGSGKRQQREEQVERVGVCTSHC